MAHWKDHLALKLSNIVAFIFFTGSSSYGALPPFFEGPHPHYLTPEREFCVVGKFLPCVKSLTHSFSIATAWIFGTWGIIHLLLIGMLIYQFTETGYHTVVEGIGWRFPMLCVLTAIFSSLANSHSNHSSTSLVLSILAFVTIIFVGATVSHIYRSIKLHHPPKNCEFASVLRT